MSLATSLKTLKTSCEQPSNSLKHRCGCFRSAAFLCIPHSDLRNDEACCILQDAPRSVDTSQHIRDPVPWLVWHVVSIKHCFNNRKRKQNDSSSVDQQSRQKRKARASLSLKRLRAWDSIFGLDILQNPNIQIPAHPDGIKFRLRFRVPYSVFAAIFHMFITKDGWNPVSASDFYGKSSYPIQVKSMCALLF